MCEQDELCSKIREFNRFYTVKMGFLNSHYIGTDYTTAEIRVLFEIKIRGECMQSEIARALNIDKSYLSRIVRRFNAKGLVHQSKSCDDKRAEIISLTQTGDKATEELIKLTNSHINARIAGLNPGECRKLASALDAVISIFKKD
ncbi:MAG: MarR family winged helix-turn-helix transcriptional regulator [Clostridiales bacterium]|nr:MarR family winged helix-turn-helix transcriptional regulator [Clostridiales bacterium]